MSSPGQIEQLALSRLRCKSSNMVKKVSLLDQPGYNPNPLLDEVMSRFGLKNDAALSRALEVRPSDICKIRKLILPISASILIKVHEGADMSFSDLRSLMFLPATE